MAKLAATASREIAQALFVTEKTVEAHLGRAYAKLEIGSWCELADALEAERRLRSLTVPAPTNEGEPH